ncbi:MAG: hypothetical protein JO071_08505, partial [Deltaproteobacteria bacterium]|nr:hypothetical protein [Deltaproteobacteria bacterium]
MNTEGETASAAGASYALPQGAEKNSWPLIAVSIVAVGGLWLFRWQLADLWSIWTTDSLRSIGMLVIPTSVVLFIRTVDRDDFSAGGSWWGL